METAQEVRDALAQRLRDDCDTPRCPGWGIFNDIEVQRCDMCCTALEKRTGIEITDEDMLLLPEARKAMAKDLGWTVARDGTVPCPAEEETGHDCNTCCGNGRVDFVIAARYVSDMYHGNLDEEEE